MATRFPPLGPALLVVLALAGCEKTTTTTTTPTGSVTTTTVSPSLPASEAMGKLREALANASAPSLGAAASRVDAQAGRATARAGEAIDDGVISTKVKAEFLLDADIRGMAIQVDTHDGVVTLTGSADTPANASRAARIAGETKGVRSVRNELVVRKPG